VELIDLANERLIYASTVIHRELITTPLQFILHYYLRVNTLIKCKCSWNDKVCVWHALYFRHKRGSARCQTRSIIRGH